MTLQINVIHNSEIKHASLSTDVSGKAALDIWRSMNIKNKKTISR